MSYTKQLKKDFKKMGVLEIEARKAALYSSLSAEKNAMIQSSLRERIRMCENELKARGYV